MHFDRIFGRAPSPKSPRARRDEQWESLDELEQRLMMAADLSITDSRFSTAGPFLPGASVIVYNTYRNVGSTATGSADIRVVLSTNNTYGDADDIEILPAASGQATTINPLNPSVTRLDTSGPFNLPANLTPGQYFFIAHAEPNGFVDAGTGNNTFVSATRITINAAAPAAELTVTTTNAAVVVTPGATFTGSVTVRNTGAAATTIIGEVRYALSTDSIWGNADDIALTSPTGTAFDPLTAGGSAQGDLSFTLGPGTPLGTYRLLAFVDPGREIAETNEANNTYISALANIVVSRPDPVLTFTSAGTLRPGGILTGTLTARNNTVAPVEPFAFQIGLFNGAQMFTIFDGVLGGPDQLNPATPALTGSQVRTIAGFQVPIPATLPPGTYQIFTNTDSTNVIIETTAGENNNISGPSGTVAVLAPLAPVTTPDIVALITVPTATVQPGQTFFIGGTLANTGTQDATNFNVSVFLSTNTVFGDADDYLLDSHFSDGTSLVPGGAWNERLAVDVPADAPAGTFYFFMQVDPTNAVAEGTAGEANNVTRSALASVTIQRPNLVGTIAGPLSVAAGAFITPTITVRNAGTFAAAGSTYTIALRPAAAVDASQDLLLATGTVGALTAGGLVAPLQSPIAIATSVAAGIYRLVINVDTLNGVAEGPTGEANAFLAVSTITVTNPGTATLPDLVASIVPITATVTPGGTLNASLRISNTGAAPATNFHVRTYFSTNTTLDGADINIDEFTVASLGMPTVQFNRSIGVPTWLLGGTFYLLTVADVDGEVAESAENNNVGVTAAPTISVIRPTISIVASDPAAGETTAPAIANTGAFLVTRTGPLTSALTVNYTIGGTATSGADYTALTGTVTIPAGAATATIIVTPTDDNVGDPGETVIATLGRGTGYSSNLAANRATVTFTDNEATVTVAATDPAGTEVTPPGTANDIRFTVTRTGSTAAPLDVSYTLGGTSDANDYGPLTGTVTIPAGQLSAQVNVVVTDDAVGELSETLTFTIVNGTGYSAGAVATATSTITDNEPVVTVLAIDPSAAQTRLGETVNPGQFRFTRTGSTAAPLDVHYTIAGTAANGDDYVDSSTNLGLTGTITIPAGQTTVVLEVRPQVVPHATSTTIIVAVDPSGAVPYRASVPNTAATVTIISLPPVNLAATQLSFTPASISISAPGLTTQFSYGIERTGLAGTLAGFSVQIRLSLNTTLGDADDIVIFTRAFAAGFTGMFNDTITLRWDETALQTPGTEYNVGLFVDSGGLISEFNEVDNRLVSDSGTIQFEA